MAKGDLEEAIPQHHDPCWQKNQEIDDLKFDKTMLEGQISELRRDFNLQAETLRVRTEELDAADRANADRHTMIEDLGMAVEIEKRNVRHLNSMLDGYRLAIKDVHHRE